ncbi:MAG: DNA repair protein RecN [Pseudomonadota bacterium]
MLRGLHIRDMLLIDQLELEFQAGLNVLTGETGAGKSILLDSLGFVLGWRGRADLVRQGAKQGEVTAWFDLPKGHSAFDVLDGAGLPHEGDLVLRRTNNADGRKTSFVNDRRVSGEILRQLSDVLVELHGQHDDRGLLNPRGHKTLLDQFGQIDLKPVRAAWTKKSALSKELENARAALADATRDQEYLAHALEELRQLAPQKGEEEELDAKRRLMQGAEKIREDVAKAAHALGGDGAEGRLSDAYRWLEGAMDVTEGRLDRPIAALERVISDLADIERGVVDTLQALSFDPMELEATEERLFAIRGLARKHQVQPDDLADLSTDLEQKLKAIELGESHIDQLVADLDAAEKAYVDVSEAVSLARHKAAHDLEEAMILELSPLKLEAAEFVADVVASDAGPDGLDQVTFMVTTNPGAPAGPINKIASGGELSRFLLALKVCLTRNAEGISMIFDEIDRGVGGATADAVGARLAAIAQRAQVLVVTHSPQVAAKGAHQWVVSKSSTADETLSTVRPLSASERVDEIARMLSGDEITDAARDAARALLAG